MDPWTIVRRRMRAQRLTGEPFATPLEAVAGSGAVQAQEHAEALWSLALRVRDCTAADVQAACDRGEILRTHVLRPTWHFVAAADLRWLLRLTGGRVQSKDAGRMRQLGLDAATLARVHETLSATLADGDPRIRTEIAAALEAAGIDMSGQRIAHAIMHAELAGVLSSGPRRGKQHTYLPLDGRVPAAPERDRDADVAELVLRYFTSHGPATLRDFAWWSGLTIADGRSGLGRWVEYRSESGGRFATPAAAADSRLAIEQAGDGTAWIAAAGADAAPPPADGAFVLGTYDELHVAYRDLRMVGGDGRPSTQLHVRPILLDGRFAGTWSRRLGRREVVVEADLHAPPAQRQRRALQTAADRFGTFVGLPARLELTFAGVGEPGSPERRSVDACPQRGPLC